MHEFSDIFILSLFFNTKLELMQIFVINYQHTLYLTTNTYEFKNTLAGGDE